MATRDESTLYTIGELAERAGLTRRTLRFYVQKGALSPPEGAGRGARYTELHLAQLEVIADAKERNVTLDRVAHFQSAEASELSSPTGDSLDATRWRRLEVAPGLELHAREDEFSATERDALSAALSDALRRLRPRRRSSNKRKRGS